MKGYQWIILLALGLVLGACRPPASPIRQGTANPVLVATAQADQYWRDAQATVQTQQLTVEASFNTIRRTAEAATAVAQQLYLAQTATVQVAQVTATYQSDLATATARAAYVTATYQSGLATATANAQATVASIAATATSQAVQATATSQAIANEQAALRLERERHLQPLRTYGPWVIGCALLLLIVGLGSWALVTAVKAWDTRRRIVPVGNLGNPLIFLDGPNGQKTVIDPGRMFGPVLRLNRQEMTMPELAPPEYQNLTTARAQAIQLQAAGSGRAISPHPPDRPWPHLTTVPLPRPAAPAPDLLKVGELPAWSRLEQWQGEGWPLGVGPAGLLVIDPDTYPHLLLAGTSGSGKTRFGLRPLIASSLTAGWLVIILDRSGLDFLPFRDHANAYTVVVNDPAGAITYLLKLYDEIQSRFNLLRQAGVSTWGRLGGVAGPRILAVLDEFANLADALPGRERDELWRAARMIAAEGRKAGVHLTIALQDPTHRSLDLRIRRNCLPVSFKVKDLDASRVVLGSGGAEKLAPRHFLTVMNGLVAGVAFDPSDEEIEELLMSRPVAPFAPPAWLIEPVSEPVAEAAVGRPEPALVVEPVAEAVPQFPSDQPPTPAGQAYIRQLSGRGLSKNAICYQLYGFKNGKVYGWISQAVKG